MVRNEHGVTVNDYAASLVASGSRPQLILMLIFLGSSLSLSRGIVRAFRLLLYVVGGIPGMHWQLLPS